MAKSYKLFSFALGAVIVASGVSAVHHYNTNDSFKKEFNRFCLSTFFDSHYYVPRGIKYSDFDYQNKTYYVHSNDVRTIVSSKKHVDGYDCLGIYDSKNSADAVFYYEVSDSTGISKFVPVSYDELQEDKNPLDVVDDLALIDETSPEEVSAYVPGPSIAPLNDYAKTLS